MTSTERIIRRLKNPFLFRLFLIKKLPMAWLSGLRLVFLSEDKAVVSLRYSYLTKNPFRSLYFACLAMAGELSSGVLCMTHAAAASAPVSILVIRVEANFTKKAVGKVLFTSTDGNLIRQAIQETIRTGEGVPVIATGTGTDESGDVVAEFKVTWSFKAKRSS